MQTNRSYANSARTSSPRAEQSQTGHGVRLDASPLARTVYKASSVSTERSLLKAALATDHDYSTYIASSERECRSQFPD